MSHDEGQKSLARLRALLDTVRLKLEVDDAGAATLLWETRRYPVSELPLDGIPPEAEEAELLAVAAAFEAAVKYPGVLAPGESLREGAASLLPKVERARFARAYDAVAGAARGTSGAEDEGWRLFTRDFGAGLVVCYVQDEGWRFRYLTRARITAWDASPDTIHSVARSNLYHKQALDWRAREVAHGDGYDAARAVLVDDVFYDRHGEGGVEIALPGRDQLLVGPGIDPSAVAAAYAESKYKLSPHVLRFAHDSVSVVARREPDTE
ncbi:MAG: hypothetical protein H6745_17205 [Deltaproteobacteria bacterium]|nr:hypothetical protein [Deltaproteobacteria bacterium]